MFGRGFYESKEICRKIQESWDLRRLFRVPRTSDPVARAPLARNWGDQDDSGRNISSCFLAGISSCPILPVLLVCSGDKTRTCDIWQGVGHAAVRVRLSDKSGQQKQDWRGFRRDSCYNRPRSRNLDAVTCCNLWDNQTCDIRCHLGVLWIRWPYETPTSNTHIHLARWWRNPGSVHRFPNIGLIKQNNKPKIIREEPSNKKEHPK